ncbi:MAG: hypothetical protein ACF8AM_19830 [Rhodopirellula sp. JB055]
MAATNTKDDDEYLMGCNHCIDELMPGIIQEFSARLSAAAVGDIDCMP